MTVTVAQAINAEHTTRGEQTAKIKKPVAAILVLRDTGNFMLFAPLPLTSLLEPFDHPEFVFELKWDGWRCIAHVKTDAIVLFSRHANEYRRFDQLKTDLQQSVRATCVLDGEIVCLDSQARPQFYDLLPAPR